MGEILDFLGLLWNSLVKKVVASLAEKLFRRVDATYCSHFLKQKVPLLRRQYFYKARMVANVELTGSTLLEHIYVTHSDLSFRD